MSTEGIPRQQMRVKKLPEKSAHTSSYTVKVKGNEYDWKQNTTLSVGGGGGALKMLNSDFIL